MKGNKQTKILKNTAILFVAMLMTKLIGAVLKIPLTNILGGLGMGYFSTAFNFFLTVYAITTAAMPMVIMRLTTQSVAERRYNDVSRIRRAGIMISLLLGTLGCMAIIVIAKPFAFHIAKSPNSLPSILITAPALICCSISAVYKGHYEGLNNMIPTAISQIVEAVTKASLGIVLALAALSKWGDITLAAAAAMLSVTLSELFGMIFLCLRARFGNKDFLGKGHTKAMLKSSPPPKRKRVIIKTILIEMFPVALAALAANLSPLIDMITIPSSINSMIPYTPIDKLDFLNGFMGGIFKNGEINDLGNFIYGSYTGITLPIFALTTALTGMIGKSALPEIAAASANKETKKPLKQSIRLLFKGVFLIGLPICIGLAALARPVLSLLYFSRPLEVCVSSSALVILGLGGVFLILSSTLFNIFLATGRADLQIKLMIIGGITKLGLNFILIRIPEINIMGAAISAVLSSVVMSIIGLIILKKMLKEKNEAQTKGSGFGILGAVIKPLLFSAFCGITAYMCYNYFFVDKQDTLRLIMSVAAGALVYLTFVSLGYIKPRPHRVSDTV